MSEEITITAKVPVAAGGTRRALLIDAAERLLVLSLFTWQVIRMVAGYMSAGGIGNLIMIVSEGLSAFLILIRRPTSEISKRPSEWLLALGATCAPFLVAAAGSKVWMPTGVAATLMVMGILIQFHAKLTLARSFGVVPAHRGLKSSGPYRFVRHPMYAGYLFTHVAFLAWSPNWHNLAVYSLVYALQIPRLLAEERFLSQDSAYREYQTQVPFRIIPGLF